jgi:hypothetical protein
LEWRLRLLELGVFTVARVSKLQTLEVVLLKVLNHLNIFFFVVIATLHGDQIE